MRDRLIIPSGDTAANGSAIVSHPPGRIGRNGRKLSLTPHQLQWFRAEVMIREGVAIKGNVGANGKCTDFNTIMDKY